jgi:sec-independent protein translocase protein TatB
VDLFSAKFLFLAVVALVVLGPDKLPSTLRTAGRLLAELRRMSAGIQEQSRSVMAEAGLAEPIEELRSAARSWRQPVPAPLPSPEPPAADASGLAVRPEPVGVASGDDQ